jgi:hypothetical protein
MEEKTINEETKELSGLVIHTKRFGDIPIENINLKALLVITGLKFNFIAHEINVHKSAISQMITNRIKGTGKRGSFLRLNLYKYLINYCELLDKPYENCFIKNIN